MRFANTILVTVLAATIQQQSSYAFSPIPKYQQVSATNLINSIASSDNKKIAIVKDNTRGRLDVHQYITSTNNDEQSDINNNEYQSLKGAAASIILGTVTATQLSVGLASAAYVDTDVLQVDISSTTVSDSVVVNNQQSISPFNSIEDSTLDSSINHFLLTADTDTATLEEKEESTTAKQKVDDAEKKLEEVAAKQKAEAAAKKKADEAKKAAAEEAAAKQKIAEQKAKDEAAAAAKLSEKAKEASTKPKEESSTKLTTEEQTLLKEGDELIKDKIERIAATKEKEDAEAQLLREKQDKIDKLYAEQKARSSTITKLKTAQEQAIQQKLTNQQAEANKRTELAKLLSNAEQYRINTAEQTRLIELDIKLTQLELVAYEERIEVIQEQVNKLEKLNDDTNVILKKLGVKGEELPKADVKSTLSKVASTRSSQSSSSMSVKPKTTSISGLSSGGSSTDDGSTSSDLSPAALGVISVFITAGTVAGAYFFNDDNTNEDSGMINDPMGGGFGNTSGGGPSFPPPTGSGLNENGFGSNAGPFPPSQSNNVQGNTFGGGASGFQPPTMKGKEQQSNNGFGSTGGMNKAQSGPSPSFGTMKGSSTPSTGFGTSSSPPQSGMNKSSFGNSSTFSSKIDKTSSPLQSGGTSSFGQQQSSGFGNITPANTMKGPQSTSNTGFGNSSPQAGSNKGFGQQKSVGFVSPESMKGSTSSAPAFGSSSGGFVSKRDSMKGGETKQQSGGTPSFGSSSTFGSDSIKQQQSGGTPSFSSPSISLKGQGGASKSAVGSSAFPSGGTSFGGVNMMKGKEAKQSSFGSSSSFGSPADKGNKQPGGFGSMKGPPVTVEKGKGAGSGFTTLDKKSSPSSSQGSGFGAGGMMKGTSSAGKDSSSSAPAFGSKGGFVSKRDSTKSSTDSTTEKKGGFSSSIGSTTKVQSGGTPSFGSGLGITGSSSTETKQSGGTPSFSGGLNNTAMKGAQSSSSPPGFGSAGGFVSKRDSTKGGDKKLQSGGTPSFGSTSTSGGDKKQSGGTPSFASGSFGSSKGGIDTKKSSVGSTAFPSGGTSFGGVNMMKGKEAGSTADKKSSSFTMKNAPKSTQLGGFGNAKGAGSGFTSLDKKSSSSPGGFDSMKKGSASSPFAASSKSSTGPGMIKDSSSPFKMGSSTEKGGFGGPQKGKEGLDAKMSKNSSVGASAFPSGGTSFGGVNMMKGKEAGPSPGKKSFGSSPAFGKKMGDKGITSPMDKKPTSSFTMKGSADSSGGGMKMDSSSPFKMGDKTSFGSPKGKGGVGLDTKMGKKSSVGASAFQSGGTSFGGVNMMKGKEAGTPGNKQPGMDGVKSVQSSGMKKSFGNSPAFGGKKMSDKSITSPIDSKKSATSAFTMKGSVDSNKMSPTKSTFGSTPKTISKASFGAGTPPKSIGSKSFSMKGSMDNKQTSFGASTSSKSFGTTSPMDNKMKSGMGSIGVKGGLGSDMKGSASKQPGGMNGMPPKMGGIGGPMKGMDSKQPGNLGGSNMPPSKGIGGIKSGSFAMKGMDNKQPGVVMPPPKTFGSPPMDGKVSPGSVGGPNKTMAVNVKGRNISMGPPGASMDSKISSPGSMGNGPSKTGTTKGSTGGSSAFGANGMSPSQPKLGQKSNTMGQQSAEMKGQISGPGPSFNNNPGSTSPNKAFGTASINSQMLDGFSPVSPGSALGSSSQGFSKQSVSSFRDGGASNQAESYRANNEMDNSGSYDSSYQGYDNSMDEYGSSQGYDNSMNSSYDQGGQMNSMGQEDYYTDDCYTYDYSSDNSMRDFRDG